MSKNAIVVIRMVHRSGGIPKALICDKNPQRSAKRAAVVEVGPHHPEDLSVKIGGK